MTGFVRGYRPPSDSEKQRAVLKPGEARAPSVFHSQLTTPVPVPNCQDDWLAQVNEEHQSVSKFLRETPWLSTRKPHWLPASHFHKNREHLPDKFEGASFYLLILRSDPSSSYKINPLLRDQPVPEIDTFVRYTRMFLNVPIAGVADATLVDDPEGDGYAIRFNHLGKPSKGRRKTRARMTQSNDKGNDCAGVTIPITTRVHSTMHGDGVTVAHHSRQLQINSVLRALQKVRPRSCLGVVMLTMEELFDEPSDLFVAGMAGGNSRSAVFSLRRYDPNLRFSTEFWYQVYARRAKSRLSEGERQLTMTLHSCKLLVHEIAHLLGFGHCTYHLCCMNGSGHLEEDFRQPHHLCPVCLRKLVCLTGVDVRTRYESLSQFYDASGLDEQVTFIKNRLGEIENGVSPAKRRREISDDQPPGLRRRLRG